MCPTLSFFSKCRFLTLCVNEGFLKGHKTTIKCFGLKSTCLYNYSYVTKFIDMSNLYLHFWWVGLIQLWRKTSMVTICWCICDQSISSAQLLFNLHLLICHWISFWPSINIFNICTYMRTWFFNTQCHMHYPFIHIKPTYIFFHLFIVQNTNYISLFALELSQW